MVEYRSHAPDPAVPLELNDRTRSLIEVLAKLLHQPKEPIFRIPSCNGWIKAPLNNQVAFMFAIPTDVKPEPRSLLSLLSRDGSVRLSLTEKFTLAYQLARCISQLHLLKWVSTTWLSHSLTDHFERSTRAFVARTFSLSRLN